MDRSARRSGSNVKAWQRVKAHRRLLQHDPKGQNADGCSGVDLHR